MMVTYVNNGVLEEIQPEHIIRNLPAKFKENSFILNYFLSYILIKNCKYSLKKVQMYKQIYNVV